MRTSIDSYMAITLSCSDLRMYAEKRLIDAQMPFFVPLKLRMQELEVIERRYKLESSFLLPIDLAIITAYACMGAMR